MPSILVVRQSGGWSVRRDIDEPAAVLIEQKVEALRVARALADRYQDSVIILQDAEDSSPQMIRQISQRSRLLRA